MEEIIVIDYYDGSVWIYKLPWLNMDDTAIDDCRKPFVLNTETNKIEEWHI